MPKSVVQIAFRLLLVLVFLFFFTAAGAFGDRGRWTAKDPCPAMIHAAVSGGSRFSSYEAVHQAMGICDNVTEIHLRTTVGSCLEWPDGYSLPFKLDGSDRYLSAPNVLSLKEYEFDSSEWEDICPGDPHWSNEDASWPFTDLRAEGEREQDEDQEKLSTRKPEFSFSEPFDRDHVQEPGEKSR